MQCKKLSWCLKIILNITNIVSHSKSKIVARNPAYLLIDGDVAARDAHPDVLVEAVADGVTDVNARVSKGSKNCPGLQKDRDFQLRFRCAAKINIIMGGFLSDLTWSTPVWAEGQTCQPGTFDHPLLMPLFQSPRKSQPPHCPSCPTCCGHLCWQSLKNKFSD